MSIDITSVILLAPPFILESEEDVAPPITNADIDFKHERNADLNYEHTHLAVER